MSDNSIKTKEIEAMVREWFQTYSDKDFESHNKLIHPDVVVVYPEMCYMSPDACAGREFLEKTLEEDEEAFVNLKQEVDNISVVGDTAFVEGWFVGDKLGGVLKDSVKGSDIRFRFLHRILVQDSMVKEIFCYYDTAILYQIQLGLEGPTKESPIAPWMMEMGKKRAERIAAKKAAAEAEEK